MAKFIVVTDFPNTDVHTDCQKLGTILEKKVVQKLKFSENDNNKKPFSKLIFFNEKKIQKDSKDFWHRKLTLKVRLRHFLTTRLKVWKSVKVSESQIKTWAKPDIFWLYSLFWCQSCHIQAYGPEGPWHSQILADQLTLSQPGEQIMPT